MGLPFGIHGQFSAKYKMRQERQDYDNVAWDLNDLASERSVKEFTRKSACTWAVSTVAKLFGKAATLVTPLRLGGYNILYRIHVEGLRRDILVRVPCPNLSQFPEEKTQREAATALLLHRATRLPVPRQFQYETKSEFGPFIIMQHVENNGDMSDILEKPRQNSQDVPVLDDNIDEDVLTDLYSKLAWCLLQLWRPEFNRIGSLNECDGCFSVGGRPITQNMSNMVQLANIPRDVLPSPNITYKTADEWYVALANMHMAQLIFQHNDLVSSAEDCRNKYISRFLFRKLAKEGKLSTFGFAEDGWSAQAATATGLCTAPSKTGPFRLWCDDLRPTNFLVDASNNIVAAIDWEFTYAAPTQFSLDPPWWLLLEMPEMWPDGMDDWAKRYERRLETWLSSMETVEVTTSNTTPFKLSKYMRESWKMGRFWLNYAARKSWAFDGIFWKYLDVRFFGPRRMDAPLWQCRQNLLSFEEKVGMEAFVEKKMDEIKERVLVNWRADEAHALLAEILC